MRLTLAVVVSFTIGYAISASAVTQTLDLASVTADKTLCKTSAGALGTCTVSLVNGLCVTGCAVP